MLDDLRASATDDDFIGFEEEDDSLADMDAGESTLFLGMTPIERMFISIFLFMNVAVIGIALLLATGRMG